MTLDLEKPLTLENGRPATLIGKPLRNATYSLVVVIEDINDMQTVWTFNCNGEPENIKGIRPDILLVNAPVEHRLEGFVNVFLRDDGTTGIAKPGCVKCHEAEIARLDLSKYNITFTEGEGLETK